MNDESEDTEMRTPEQIIAEFAGEACSILSGRQARADKDSRIGGEAMNKFRNRPGAVTRGLGHSPWACTGGRYS